MWFLILRVASAEPTFERHEACDLPTAPLASLDTADAETCEATCRDRADCGAWTFVSGWGRCRLYAPTERRATVHLVAARIEGLEGARTVGLLQRDHDHAGKDLEAAPRDLPTAEACAEACLATAACVGLVYVEGYRSCWLKQTDGTIAPKTFTCGLRR